MENIYIKFMLSCSTVLLAIIAIYVIRIDWAMVEVRPVREYHQYYDVAGCENLTIVDNWRSER